MTIKNIIFDVGNVIVRWSPIDIIKITFPEHDPNQHQFLYAAIFKSNIWIQLNLGQLSESEAKKAYLSKIPALSIEQAENLFNHIKSSQELIPGTVDIIKTLHKKKYRLYALTDNVREIIEYLKNRYDFWQYFTNIIVSAHIGLMKPSKEIFNYTMQNNILLPHETLFIDDHLPNVKAADELGLHTILFSDSATCLKELNRLLITQNDN